MYLFILAYLILFLSFFTYDERFNLPTNDILSEAQIPPIDGSKLTGEIPSSVKISYNNLLDKPLPQAPPDLTGYAAKTDLTTYAAKTDLTTYALKTDLTNYALKTDLATAGGGYKSGDSPTFGTVTCGSLNITSDRRIKKNIQPLVSLDLLRKLKPVRYKLKHGEKEVCGFIAQEILETIPEAVSTQTGVMSNICDEATIDKDILTFSTFLTSDLSYDAEKKPYKMKVEEELVVILEVLDEHRIRIETDKDNVKDNVKVYVLGQEVSDFLSIDSHQIFTVATAAVQELDAKVQQLDEKVQHLNEKVRILDALDEKVQRLEALCAKVRRLEEENKVWVQRFNRLEECVNTRTHP